MEDVPNLMLPIVQVVVKVTPWVEEDEICAIAVAIDERIDFRRQHHVANPVVCPLNRIRHYSAPFRAQSARLTDIRMMAGDLMRSARGSVGHPATLQVVLLFRSH